MDYCIEKIGDRVKATVSCTTDEIMDIAASIMDGVEETPSETETNIGFEIERFKENFSNELKQCIDRMKPK